MAVINSRRGKFISYKCKVWTNLAARAIHDVAPRAHGFLIVIEQFLATCNRYHNVPLRTRYSAAIPREEDYPGQSRQKRMKGKRTSLLTGDSSVAFRNGTDKAVIARFRDRRTDPS